MAIAPKLRQQKTLSTLAMHWDQDCKMKLVTALKKDFVPLQEIAINALSQAAVGDESVLCQIKELICKDNVGLPCLVAAVQVLGKIANKNDHSVITIIEKLLLRFGEDRRFASHIHVCLVVLESLWNFVWRSDVLNSDTVCNFFTTGLSSQISHRTVVVLTQLFPNLEETMKKAWLTKWIESPIDSIRNKAVQICAQQRGDETIVAVAEAALDHHHDFVRATAAIFSENMQ